MFLANYCLLMASLTFSLISWIILLFFLVLGMIFLPLEWVSSYSEAHNSRSIFPITVKSPIKARIVALDSKSIKIIPKTSKNIRGIPDMNEKVKLANKRQQLARNMKKIGEKSKKKRFFLVFLVTRQTFGSLARPWKLMILI